MAFTAQELNNMANAALDYFLKGPAMAQTLEDRPTLKAMRDAQKTFPGGKGSIRGNVKGEYSTTMSGYSGDDTVTYTNPANMKQFDYAWKELHGGISITNSELKVDGISVVDNNGADTVTHTEAEMTRISSLFDDKLDDLAEGSMRSFNGILWRDGTQDSKAFGGIQSIILPTATVATGTTGGIDRSVNTWWRNRALTGVSKITSSTSLQTLTKTLRSEARQLTRYGGKPSLLPAGSEFINRLEAEVHEKGTYTQEGFTNSGKTDIGMAKISMRGIGSFYYEPELDNLGLQYFGYFIDPRRLYLDAMENEDMKPHTPNSPADQYVIYRSVTWTGGLVANQLNCHGVYEVAA